MPDISIYFTGVALGYQPYRDSDPSKWNILFPVSECHSIKFSYEAISEDPREAATTRFVGHLGNPGSDLEVFAMGVVGPVGTTQSFDEQVFDFTRNGYTHDAIRATSDWNAQGVLMKLNGAQFDVYDELIDTSGKVPVVTDGVTERSLGVVAHSVVAAIKLTDNGRCEVRYQGRPIFGSEAGVSYRLWFDNDCPPYEIVGNDTELFYKLIVDAAEPRRKYRVEGRRKGGIAIKFPPRTGVGSKVPMSGPPYFDADKPCLFARATKPDNLPR